MVIVVVVGACACADDWRLFQSEPRVISVLFAARIIRQFQGCREPVQLDVSDR